MTAAIRNARAFTLIELLASLALSAALMGVGFKVLRTLARPTASTLPAWVEPLSGQLRWNAMHAIVWRPTDQEITFAGHLATDPSTLEPLHRPALIALRVERVGGIDWLVRDESTIGTRLGHSVTSQLLCAGVRAIRLINLDPPPRPPPHPLTANAKTAAASSIANDLSVAPVFRNLPGFARMPDRFRIVVEFTDASRPPLTIEEATP